MTDSYVCPICGARSHHPEDVRQGYCGRCHAFTRWCTIGGCDNAPDVVAGNVALCQSHADEIGDGP